MNVLIISHKNSKGKFQDITYCQIPHLKKFNRFHSLLRSVKLKISKHYIQEYFNEELFYELEIYDVVILFDCMGYKYIADKINKKKYTGRKILFLWNPSQSHIYFDSIKSWEIWTFDPVESRKYGFKYGGQFMDNSNYLYSEIKPIKYDLYFCGIDKGRFKTLSLIKEQLKDRLRIKFRLVTAFKWIFFQTYSKRISFNQCIEEESESKCIMDFYQKYQSGLTLRTVESIFLQKKVITNNILLRNYKLFRFGNIEIIDLNNIENIEHFIKKQFSPYPENIIEEYKFNSWLKRIINNIEAQDYNF